MDIINQPQPTTYQIGDAVYFLENNLPQKGYIAKSITTVSDVDNNNTAEVETIYELEGKGTQPFKESRLYESKEDLETAMDALIGALS